MKLEDLKDKKIAVLGLGVEGISTLLYLKRHGLSAVGLDEKKADESSSILSKQGIDFKVDMHAFVNLDQYDILFRSPGIPLNHKEIVTAKEKGIIVYSAIKLFFDLCPSPVIGVTGTKGKGTTSTLIYEMLKKSGKDAYLGGNIGLAPLDFLDNLSEQSFVVLELSSFQLEDVDKSPHIAVLLMITSEHLGKDNYGTQNYHKSLEDYISAKRNILKFQTVKDIAIINRDYPASNESDVYTQAKVYLFSRERKTENGCYALNGEIILNISGSEEKVININEVTLPGKHNLENICAAVMAARLVGVNLQDIRHTLKTFKGLRHRIELIGSVNGVLYYDDSFSTTPDTAIAAIESFKQPKILILGGASKNSDFTELGRIISEDESIKAVIGIGDEWERIKKEIGSRASQMLIIEGAKNMEQIVKAASKIAGSGDVVLLSPACTSFGMFKNYKDRGDQFRQQVQNLPQN